MLGFPSSRSLGVGGQSYSKFLASTVNQRGFLTKRPSQRPSAFIDFQDTPFYTTQSQNKAQIRLNICLLGPYFEKGVPKKSMGLW